MKNLLALLFLTVLVGKTNAGVIIIEGKYQNKNLFVQNYFGNSGVGFCAQEIKVNGKITTDETNSSAFEIDLSALQLKFGEQVTVEISHKEGCLPKVLNADDLLPKPTFDVLVMNISETGLLKWTTKNESGALPYIIETFKWNKWIPVGEVGGAGTLIITIMLFKLKCTVAKINSALSKKEMQAYLVFQRRSQLIQAHKNQVLLY
ncbi:MAG: hypothetical protein IPJ60_17755 [Sphingobacteriaceae bacterium]|nr:hypothetical protein [Sphingobacteriaceae bacterium]